MTASRAETRSTAWGRIPAHWDLAPWKSFATRSGTAVVVSPDTELDQVTVRVRHKGVVRRTPTPHRPRRIRTPNQTLVSAGQFVISKIDARNGACGFIPADLDGAIVTNDFPVYDIHGAMNPRYLHHLVDLPRFWRLCETVSDGTTNRVRLDLNLFNDLEFPVPSQEEQLAIAALLDSIDDAIDGAADVAATSQSAADALREDFPTKGLPGNRRGAEGVAMRTAGCPALDWPVVRLGAVAEVNPRRPALRTAPDTTVPFVPMRAVAPRGRGLLPLQTRSFRNVSSGYSYFADGDILFAKITPCMENGKHAIADLHGAPFGFGTTEFHVIRPGPQVTVEYLFDYLTQRPRLDYCAKQFTGSAGQRRVPADALRSLPLPLPALSEQQRMSRVLRGCHIHAEALRAAVGALSRLRVALSGELLTGRLGLPARETAS